MYTAEQIAQSLDLAVLRPTATCEDIISACELVKQHQIRTICVAPIYVKLAVGEGAPVSAVIGYPHGTSTPSQKRNEAVAMIDDGAIELDVVINYGRLLDGDHHSSVEQELTAIVDLAKQQQVLVKAILETCFYTVSTLEVATRFCVDLEVDFVETSSGYGLHGATPLSVKTMLEVVRGAKTQIKASGGIVCYNDAAKYLDLGCTRLGASRFKELLP